MKPTLMPQPLRDILRERGERMHLAPGEVLFRKDEPSDAIYLVEQGCLKVHLDTTGQDENEVMLNLVMPGELTGEIGAITGWLRTATLTAEQPTHLVRIPLNTLRTLLHEIPDLAALMMETAGRHLLIADADRVSLGRSYRQMHKRILDLDEEQAQLREIMRMREEMESMIVHDLRNPLNVIRAGLDILAALHPEGMRGGPFANTHGLIAQAAQRIQMLVNTMLDIAKMEAGRFTLNRSTFDLAEILRTLVEQQQALAADYDIALEYTLPPTYAMQADRDVLYRVFANLVDNALKFTPPGGCVRVEAELRGENWVLIKISDTGPGIPPAERARIFEKFTQIEGASTHTMQRGTGLGLTFCQMAVEAHGGQIWVEDGPDSIGATFISRLPRILETV